MARRSTTAGTISVKHKHNKWRAVRRGDSGVGATEQGQAEAARQDGAIGARRARAAQEEAGQEEQAEKHQDDLFHGMQLLAYQENLGKDYSFADKPYRKFNVNRHLIFYRTDRLNCIIIRILHDRMDIKNQLL